MENMLLNQENSCARKKEEKTYIGDAGAEVSLDVSNNLPWNNAAPASLIMDRKTIGDFIRQFRELKELSQDDFANLSGVSKRTLFAIEKGMQVKEESLAKVLKFMGYELKTRFEITKH